MIEYRTWTAPLESHATTGSYTDPAVGPYAIVRHPLYLAYLLADIGYNLQEWNPATLLLVAAGWTSMIYRIIAEERVLSRVAHWSTYANRVRYRLLPGIW